MAEARLSINSRNYGSWSLRGWLLCKMAGLDVAADMVSADDPTGRAELLHAIASHHERRAARTAEAAVLYHVNQLDAVAATRPVDRG